MTELPSLASLSPGDRQLLRRLDPSADWLADVESQGCEVLAAGPFCLLHAPDMLGLDYAFPVEGPASPADVRAGVAILRRLCDARRIRLRIEFNEPLFPDLAAILEEEGLALEEREPLLLLPPDEFRPRFAPAVTVRFLGANDDDAALIDYQTIFSEILLERPLDPAGGSIERLRREIERCGGRCHALASVDGRPVGTGFISSSEGVCEITRVATLPEARRRGVAATLTSFMTRDRFGGGDTLAWLTASGEPAQRLYQGLGFRLVGDRLYFTDGGLKGT